MGYPLRRPKKMIFYFRALIGNREAIEAKKRIRRKEKKKIEEKNNERK